MNIDHPYGRPQYGVDESSFYELGELTPTFPHRKLKYRRAPSASAGSNPEPSQRSQESTLPEKADPYCYSPLESPSSIRLLEIKPGESFQPIECRLFERNTNSLPEYEAISYVWGNDELSKEICCDGKSLRLTNSLEAALRRVRLSDHIRIVWADAVCINQANLAERGHQVKLMQQIYTSATRVLVWLGEQNAERVRIAFDLVHKISRLAANEVNDAVIIPGSGDKRWQALSDLFGSSWFWRLWVIQEITSAPSGLVMWGDYEISWLKVGLTAAWLRATGYEVFHKAPMVGVFNAYLMHGISEETRRGWEPSLFRGLLTLTRQFQSTDPRDRVYAILGLPHQDRSVSNSIEPDYTKCTDEVYFEAAQKILMGPNPMKLLGAVQHGPSLDQEESLDLPSWVPQWHRLYAHRLEPGGVGGVEYNASIGIEQAQLRIPRAAEPLSASVLSVEGFRFRNVISVSEVFKSQTMVSETWSTIFKTWKSLILPHVYFTPHHADIEAERAYAEALVAGKDWYGEMADPDEAFGDFISFWWYATSSLEEPEGRTIFSSVDDERLATYKSNGNGSSYERFVEAMKNGCEGRRIFIAEDGFIGLGPEALEPGDYICVLAGSRVLLALRPREQHHRLVGEAYIPGMMNGEAVEEWKSGGLMPLQTFQLQ